VPLREFQGLVKRLMAFDAIAKEIDKEIDKEITKEIDKGKTP
jgi:hypothetical protein